MWPRPTCWSRWTRSTKRFKQFSRGRRSVRGKFDDREHEGGFLARFGSWRADNWWSLCVGERARWNHLTDALSRVIAHLDNISVPSVSSNWPHFVPEVCSVSICPRSPTPDAGSISYWLLRDHQESPDIREPMEIWSSFTESSEWNYVTVLFFQEIWSSLGAVEDRLTTCQFTDMSLRFHRFNCRVWQLID